MHKKIFCSVIINCIFMAQGMKYRVLKRSPSYTIENTHKHAHKLTRSLSATSLHEHNIYDNLFDLDYKIAQLQTCSSDYEKPAPDLFEKKIIETPEQFKDRRATTPLKLNKTQTPASSHENQSKITQKFIATIIFDESKFDKFLKKFSSFNLRTKNRVISSLNFNTTAQNIELFIKKNKSLEIHNSHIKKTIHYWGLSIVAGLSTIPVINIGLSSYEALVNYNNNLMYKASPILIVTITSVLWLTGYTAYNLNEARKSLLDTIKQRNKNIDIIIRKDALQAAEKRLVLLKKIFN